MTTIKKTQKNVGGEALARRFWARRLWARRPDKNRSLHRVNEHSCGGTQPEFNNARASEVINLQGFPNKGSKHFLAKRAVFLAKHAVFLARRAAFLARRALKSLLLFVKNIPKKTGKFLAQASNTQFIEADCLQGIQANNKRPGPKPQHLIALGVIVLLSACSRQAPTYLIEGAAQGTRYHITYVAPTNFSPAQQAALSGDISQELERLDKAISNYRPDSDIEVFNSQATTAPLQVSEEIVHLIEQARTVHTASGGCYDPTIKPLFDLWGFKRNVFSPPSEEALAATLQLVGMDKLITLDKTHLQKKIPNLRVDLSSIGQGYSIGKLAAILDGKGINNYIVEIGGELTTRGQKPGGKPWRLALEKPLSNVQKIAKIAVFNTTEPMSMMPSGTYHHYFDAAGKRYSHILDARTGKPIEHNSASATVLNPNPTLADAWSTALLCLGSQEGITLANAQGIAALFIDQNGEQLSEKPTQALKNLSGVTFEDVASE